MRRYFLMGFLLMALFYARGQDGGYIQPPALAMHFVFNDFVPVTTSRGASFHETKAGLAASYIKGLDRRIDVMGTIAGSILQFPFRKGGMDGRELLLLEGDVSIRCKLLPCYYWLSPYVHIGAGLSDYQGNVGVLAPMGIGTQVNLNPFTFLLLDAQYRAALTQQQTGHFFYSLGLGGIIRKKKTSVVRKTVPAPVLTVGALVERKSSSSDSDGDGIPDDKDKCPLTPGWAAYDGCPPPSGGDMVVRSGDTAWSIADRLRAAAGRVYFATGKYVLLPASFPALDEVVGMLKEIPSLKIEIQGHTDSVGVAGDNLLLSQRRAEAVMKYLTRKGAIDEQRLKAFGYGPMRPIATNTTEEGRALNRRVEFRIANN
ncbi:MAG TPA: OmpA family protein [Puia sp.]|nr:OmpA family protein [Puia sp.]